MVDAQVAHKNAQLFGLLINHLDINDLGIIGPGITISHLDIICLGNVIGHLDIIGLGIICLGTSGLRIDGGNRCL